MEKNVIRLNESELRSMINEAVLEFLREYDETDFRRENPEMYDDYDEESYDTYKDEEEEENPTEPTLELHFGMDKLVDDPSIPDRIVCFQDYGDWCDWYKTFKHKEFTVEELIELAGEDVEYPLFANEYPYFSRRTKEAIKKFIDVNY